MFKESVRVFAARLGTAASTYWAWEHNELPMPASYRAKVQRAVQDHLDSGKKGGT
jgi:hypothetical protein